MNLKSHTWLTTKVIVKIIYKNNGYILKKSLHFVTFLGFDKITLNYHMHYVSLHMTNTLCHM